MATIGIFNPDTFRVERRDQATWGETFSVMFGQAHSDLVTTVFNNLHSRYQDYKPQPYSLEQIEGEASGEASLLGTLHDRCKIFTDFSTLASACEEDDFTWDAWDLTDPTFWGKLIAYMVQKVAIAIWDLCSTGALKQQIDQAVFAANLFRYQNHPEQISINETLFVALGVDALDETIEIFEKAHPEKVLLKVDLQEDTDGYAVAYVTLGDPDIPVTLEQIGVIATLFTEFHKVYVFPTQSIEILRGWDEWGFQKDDTGNWWVAEDLDESVAKYDFGDGEKRTWDELIDHCNLRDFANFNICTEPESDTEEE